MTLGFPIRVFVLRGWLKTLPHFGLIREKSAKPKNSSLRSGFSGRSRSSIRVLSYGGCRKAKRCFTATFFAFWTKFHPRCTKSEVKDVCTMRMCNRTSASDTSGCTLRFKFVIASSNATWLVEDERLSSFALIIAPLSCAIVVYCAQNTSTQKRTQEESAEATSLRKRFETRLSFDESFVLLAVSEEVSNGHYTDACQPWRLDCCKQMSGTGVFFWHFDIGTTSIEQF